MCLVTICQNSFKTLQAKPFIKDDLLQRTRR